MADSKDDLDAVRAIVEALESFSNDERERILRWSAEKLGMQALSAGPSGSAQPAAQIVVNQIPAAPHGGGNKPDLKSFVAEKQPSNDVHFAATVAYFYAFEANENERSSTIGSEDLQNACRLTGRERLQNPGQTLRNASFRGLLDKGDDRGQYKLNTVGENLVAVTLPGTPDATSRKRKPAKKKVKAASKEKGNTTKKTPSKKKAKKR